MENLPCEIWFIIFDMSNIEDVMTSSMTCKYILSLCENYWNDIETIEIKHRYYALATTLGYFLPGDTQTTFFYANGINSYSFDKEKISSDYIIEKIDNKENEYRVVGIAEDKISHDCVVYSDIYIKDLYSKINNYDSYKKFCAKRNKIFFQDGEVLKVEFSGGSIDYNKYPNGFSKLSNKNTWFRIILSEELNPRDDTAQKINELRAFINPELDHNTNEFLLLVTQKTKEFSLLVSSKQILDLIYFYDLKVIYLSFTNHQDMIETSSYISLLKKVKEFLLMNDSKYKITLIGNFYFCISAEELRHV